MRGIGAIALSLVVVLVGAGAGSTSATTRPKLKLLRPAPLQLKATGFRSNEVVRVRVVTPKPASKRVSANGAGAFVVGFPTVAIDRCSGFSIVAVGSRGTRASLKRVDVYCPPPLRSP